MNTKNQLLSCEHCGLECLAPVYEDDHVFCCIGCRGVYRLLNDQGLSKYYELKQESVPIRDASPVEVLDTQFSYLDTIEFLQEYTITNSFGQPTMEFYLEGVHCVACLWLIEKLPQYISGVQSATLNLGRSIATITLKDGGSFSAVASTLNQIGYRPHPLQNESDADKMEKKENRSMLIKIGISGACAGNIMLLAVSLYSGVEGELAKYFQWLTFAISLPAILYSATPFYKSAWGALKAKVISIDLPIVIAIVIGSLSGLYNLSIGKDDIYFDSLTILIFLLLAARYLLKVAQQKGLRASEASHFFTSGATLKYNEESKEFEPIHAKYLDIGDIIKVMPSEVLPVDGLITAGESTINNSLLTGESDPVKVTKHSNVYSGTVNLNSPIEIEVTNIGATTRLGKILKSVENSFMGKAPIATLTDKISEYFVLTVLAIAVLTFIYFLVTQDFAVAFNRALTLVIITCPCALGLATPLALAAATSKLNRKGTIIKGDDVIEKLSKAENIFLDKTGTITYGTFQVSEWEDITSVDHLKPLINSLEKRSRHPVAKALVQYIEENFYSELKIFSEKKIEIENFSETLGSGVSATINQQYIEVVALKHCDRTAQQAIQKKLNQIGIYINQQLVAKISLSDKVRRDAPDAIKSLKQLGIIPGIISGDIPEVVETVRCELNITSDLAWAKISPEKKNEIVSRYDNAIMVGDGANDALALSQSFVGIAVAGSVEVSLRAADVYLTSPGVTPIVNLIEISKESMKVIYRNLTFSLIYNVLGTVLAIMGLVTPLLAAVLMPISSITVIASTLIGTNRLRKS